MGVTFNMSYACSFWIVCKVEISFVSLWSHKYFLYEEKTIFNSKHTSKGLYVCTYFHFVYKWWCKYDISCLHHAFFDNFGFVEIEAIEAWWMVWTKISTFFIAFIFMLDNSLLADSYVKSHHKVGYLMP